MTLHINRPRYSEYIARWHERGRKKYTVISRHRTAKSAMRAVFKWVERAEHPRWNRADVLAYQKWYGFTTIIEVKR